MTPPPVRRVLGIVPDLFFSTRIAAVAKSEGIQWRAALPRSARTAAEAETPDLVIIDLHAEGALDAIADLKQGKATQALAVIGFYSHVDVALRAAALAAGADHVLPRSAFTQRLPDLLSGRIQIPVAPEQR